MDAANLANNIARIASGARLVMEKTKMKRVLCFLVLSLFLATSVHAADKI